MHSDRYRTSVRRRCALPPPAQTCGRGDRESRLDRLCRPETGAKFSAHYFAQTSRVWQAQAAMTRWWRATGGAMDSWRVSSGRRAAVGAISATGRPTLVSRRAVGGGLAYPPITTFPGAMCFRLPGPCAACVRQQRLSRTAVGASGASANVPISVQPACILPGPEGLRIGAPRDAGARARVVRALALYAVLKVARFNRG